MIENILHSFFQKGNFSFRISPSLLPEETWNANPDTKRNAGATSPFIKVRIPNQPACFNSGIRNALKTWTSIIIMIAQPRSRSIKTYLTFSFR